MNAAIKNTLLVLAVFVMALLAAGCPPVPVITVLPSAMTIYVGQTVPLTAQSTDSKDVSFSWVSSDASVASADPADGVTVTVTGLAPGTATFTATGSKSGQTGEAVITVIQQSDEDEGNPFAPGLNVEITNVVIRPDRAVEITFTPTTDEGGAIPLSEMTEVRFVLAYLTSPSKGSTPRYTSYTTTTEDPDRVPNSGDEAIQATYDSAGLGGVTQNPDNSMTYVFASRLPDTYDAAATHQVGGQFSRVYVMDGKTYKANAVYRFRPDGNKALDTREIVLTQSCNECHTRLSLHGDIRREVQLCILCHSPQSVDANTGNTIDFPVMIHKIHQGANLPSVGAGTPYQIYGYRDSVNDYSTVHYPQDTRHCNTCHDGSAPQGDYYLTRPTMAGCGACHDRTWFGNPNQTPEGFVNHPYDFLQTDDSACATCHTPQAPGVVPIIEAHLTPTETEAAPGFALDIVGVNANPADGTLQITFTAAYGDGAPVTDLTQISRISADVAYPAPEYQTQFSESIQGTTPPAGVLESATSGTGTYVYTFARKLPPNSPDTFAVALEGRLAFDLDGTMYNQGTASNGLVFFTMNGQEPTPRRAIVDEAKCNKCHGEIRAHGESRTGVDLCVMCHKYDATDISQRPAGQMPPVTIHFKDMLHRIHTGENLENGCIIYGYGSRAVDFSDVQFPGDRTQCAICHISGAETVPLPPEALPTIVMEGDTLVSEILPERAACTSCHDSLPADVHAAANSNLDRGVESCVICHGSDAAFAVPAIHAATP